MRDVLLFGINFGDFPKYFKQNFGAGCRRRIRLYLIQRHLLIERGEQSFADAHFVGDSRLSCSYCCIADDFAVHVKNLYFILYCYFYKALNLLDVLVS